MMKKVELSVSIDSSPTTVRKYLTEPSLMKIWMGEPDMNIEVRTDWTLGNLILIKGFHHVHFENKGMVLQFDPQRRIQYGHLSSMSHLPDLKENQSIITFSIDPQGRKVVLKVQVENFPTESIYKHLAFYWQGTVQVLKNRIEQERKVNIEFKP